MDRIKELRQSSDLKGVPFTSGNHLFYSETNQENQVSYHLQDAYSFKYCSEGLENYFVNGQQKQLKKGEVLVINPNSNVTWSCSDKIHAKGFSAFVSSAMIAEANVQFDPEEFALIENSSNKNKYDFFDHPFACQKQIGNLFEIYLQNKVVYDKADGFLLELSRQMVLVNEPCKKMMHLKHPSKTATKLELIKRLSIANDLIRQSLYQDITLNIICKEAGLSKFHFVRSFKQVYDISPMQLLVQLRLKESLELMKKEMPISQVLSVLHFYDLSHFNRSFKKLFGISPYQVF